MDIVFDRCAGIDVHKRTVVVCRVTRDVAGARLAETQTFGTTTSDLLRLSDWLAEGGCMQVGLESTGEYTLPTMLPKRWRSGSMGSRSCLATFVRV